MRIELLEKVIQARGNLQIHITKCLTLLEKLDLVKDHYMNLEMEEIKNMINELKDT